MRPLVALFVTLGLCGCVPRAPELVSVVGPDPDLSAVPNQPPPALRLPAHTRPVHYFVDLKIDPEAPGFSGTVAIDVRLSEPLRTLWMHGENLDVEVVRVRPVEGEWMEAQWVPRGDRGLAAVRLPETLEPGPARIEIQYSALFGEKLRGLYRVREGGRAYAFTQFEPLSAREAFPCFDEPVFKTPFDVRLIVPEGQVAIANTLQTAQRPHREPGMVEHVFATTQPLPTYLIAFAVGPLDVVAGPVIPPTEIRPESVPFRGVAVAGRGDDLGYALEHTPPMVAALERYFATPYPFDKLDVIAVPDFSAGAMENAGAITFREPFLLLDESASQAQLRGFAEVMAHELAHQWFGNLVTMPFWDDLWLNEAFATWMATRVVDELYPDYELHLDELRHAHYAMRIDEKQSARAIRQPIESVHDIENAFDGITYAKGGAVLAMFERYLGAETFRAGLRRYIEEHAFGSATAEDLVAALSEAAGEPLAEPFFSFLTQPGVPLVHARAGCTDGTFEVALAQQRYVPLGGEAPPQAHWELPVCIRFGAGDEARTHCALARESEATFSVDVDECPTWWMPNADAGGYYRWSLPEPALAALSTRGWPHLTEAERISTVDNLAAALRAGAAPPEQAYLALLRFIEDGNRHVTSTALSPLSFAHDYLLEPAQQEIYRERLAAVLGPRLKELGFVPREGEPGETALLRAALVSAACLEARMPGCRQRYAEAGRARLGLAAGDDAPAITSDLAGTALTVAVQEGGAAAFDAALERLASEQEATERSRLLWALGRVQDPELAARARELALDPRLRVNEVMLPLWAQARLPSQREATWQWALEHIEELAERLPGRRAGQLVGLASDFCSEEKAEAVRATFQQYAEELVGAPRELANVVEGIQLCAARRAALQDSARRVFSSPQHLLE